MATREARTQLKTRGQPYWNEVRRGLALGYRRGAAGGTWWLREHRNGRSIWRRIGIADDTVPADGKTVFSWTDALARAVAPDRPTVSEPGRYLVREAANAYFQIRQKQSATEHDRFTYEKFIEPKLGGETISGITTGELQRWLADQVLETEDREKRRAQQATANRRFTVLRAILNAAYRNEPQNVPSADAWRRVRPFQGVDQPRLRTLTAEEARRLLNALPTSLRALARGALYTGCRLGELLALTVAHVEDSRVHVQHSKSGRSRHIPLTADGAAFFEQMTAGKSGSASVFPPPNDAEAWPGMVISRGMRAACVVAKISPPATFHDLRRSYGSLLLNSGAPADVIQELLGHADLRMTRRAYAHLLDKTLQKVVKKHLPSFGLEPSTVKPLRAGKGA